ncbi:MAG TPA: HDOD domain-containing protein [Terriglobales bacterium]
MSAARTVSLGEMASRINALDRIPSIPAILLPLLRLLEVAPEAVDVQRVVDLISHDKSLAIQTLHMANSPLFGRYQNIRTIRGAVLALGIDRVREMATTCCILKLLPAEEGAFDIRTLWEHSLGVALVGRRFARKIGFPDPEQAYLAGLLHDIGVIVNLIAVRDSALEALGKAKLEGIPLDRAEMAVIGFPHSVSGGLLAERWSLNQELKEVIRRHHEFERAQNSLELVALINVADLLCRFRGLGHGYEEERCVCFTMEASFRHLSEKFPVLWRTDLEKFTFELDGYIKEVKNLVSVLFRMK